MIHAVGADRALPPASHHAAKVGDASGQRAAPWAGNTASQATARSPQHVVNEPHVGCDMANGNCEERNCL